MRRIFLSTSVLALSLVGSSPSVGAQEPIEYRPIEGFAPARPNLAPAPSLPGARFREAEARASEGGYDPQADALLAAAAKFTKMVFNVPSLALQRAVTQRVPAGPQRGDVLIAEWKFEEPFAKGAVVLNDTPYYSTYDFRLRDCNIRTQAELTTFLKTFLVWDKEPLRFNSDSALPLRPGMGGVVPGAAITVFLPPTSAVITSFSGWPSTPRSVLSFVADFLFDGLFEGREWFLQFRVGKWFTQGIYPVRAHVPERFPPLDDQAKSWSSVQIRGEVGNTVKPFEGVPEFTGERDRILIAELARRGLSQDQVLDLLTDVERTADGYHGRLISVIEGIRASGTDPFINRFFAPTLKAYEGIGPVAAKAVETLFGSAAVPRCPVDVEADALAVLKKGVFFEGPLNYLAFCSTSPETLAALQALNVPAEWQRQRNFAIDNVQGNIKLPKRTGKPGAGR